MNQISPFNQINPMNQIINMNNQMNIINPNMKDKGKEIQSRKRWSNNRYKSI